jgi:intracellular sulfur oxidation DsrE/DsrF family protein
MYRDFPKRRAVWLTLAVTLPVAAAFAEGQQHRLVIHVSSNSEQKMTAALNIIEATQRLYREQGDTLVVEVVTNGPGLNMLRADRSPVKKRISLLSTQYDNVRFSACANTQANMKKKEGRDIDLVSDATVVPGGVFRIMELTESGYQYIRP